jgi:DNA processing protein
LLLYKIGLTLIPGVGDINGKKLVAYCGGVEAVFKEKRGNLLKIPGIGQSVVNSIHNSKILLRSEEEMKFIEKYQITPLFYLDDDYPTRLTHCVDSPILLYYKGNANLNSEKIVSIVGTRNASTYGKGICEKIVDDLQSMNIIVVSGLAYGIDTCAHIASLKNGLKTIAVLAHGLDIIYPQQNKTLSKKLLKNGGLLTEFMTKSKPDRENFPKRNRIVAGLCDAVIVIESSKKGGALITANIANSYNRDVFAVPGNVGEKLSEGCNNLIKTNRAALIQSAEDLKYIMGWESETQISTSKQRKLFVKLSDEEEILFNILKEKKEMDIDTLRFTSNLSMSKVAAALLNMEFEGILISLPGKIYRLC